MASCPTSLHTFHPFEDRAGNAGIRGVGRHYLGDVAVILKRDVGWTSARLAELIFQGIRKRDDVGRIELGNGDEERQL